MNRRLFITAALIVFVVGWCIGNIIFNAVEKKPSKPCTDKACIKIVEQDGSTFTLNDFRLIQDHCVLFVSLPDNAHREACGNWQMSWIGPQ